MAQQLPIDTSRLGAIAGTPIERELLLNDDLKRAMLGPTLYQPGQALGDELADFSPIGWMLGQEARERPPARMRLGAHAICQFDISEFDDAGMAHLALQLAGRSWDEVYDYLRARCTAASWRTRSATRWACGTTPAAPSTP